jgi:coenzyme PQQ precursor peptide PqqA
VAARRGHGSRRRGGTTNWRPVMQWMTPAFEDLRFGFEITMYIASR